MPWMSAPSKVKNQLTFIDFNATLFCTIVLVVVLWAPVETAVNERIVALQRFVLEPKSFRFALRAAGRRPVAEHTVRLTDFTA